MHIISQYVSYLVILFHCIWPFPLPLHSNFLDPPIYRSLKWNSPSPWLWCHCHRFWNTHSMSPIYPKTERGKGLKHRKIILLLLFLYSLKYCMTFTTLLFEWVDVVDLSDLLVVLLRRWVAKVDINVDTIGFIKVLSIRALRGTAISYQDELPEEKIKPKFCRK